MAAAASLTWRFNVAIQFAMGLHHNQHRKATSIPYIAHLMSVCALVLEAGGDEDQAISALLHDAVEDQGGLATLATIRQLFGDRVADTVEACSDSTTSNPDHKLPWRQRKEKYLKHLTGASPDALIVSAADKLHNARSILADYRLVGDTLWSRFNVGKADQLWYYTALVEVLKTTSAPRSLVEDVARAVSELETLTGSCRLSDHDGADVTPH